MVSLYHTYLTPLLLNQCRPCVCPLCACSPASRPIRATACLADAQPLIAFHPPLSLLGPDFPLNDIEQRIVDCDGGFERWIEVNRGDPRDPGDVKRARVQLAELVVNMMRYDD